MMDINLKSKGEALEWYRDVVKNGNVSQETLKDEVMKYFGQDLEYLDKKTIAKKMRKLKDDHYNIKNSILRQIQKLKNGKGNGFANPPDNFSPEIMDEKERKSAFVKSCRIEIDDHEMYQNWKNEPFSLNLGENQISKKDSQFGNNESESIHTQSIKITKQRSCGPNIFDTEKVVILEKPDGTVKKTVIKETFATVTRRKRKASTCDKENDISDEAQRKRARNVDNILNHVNENNKDHKAKMISKIIDAEGPNFGKKVKLSSKVLQENDSLTVVETNNLQVATRSSGFLWRQTRTALRKTLGYSPLASAKK